MPAQESSGRSVIAIAWMRHRRMVGICDRLGIPLFALTTRRKGVVRWLELAFRTIALLARERPRAVFVQNPSIVLVMLALALRPVLRFRLVVDAHNEAVDPVVHSGRIVRRVARRLLARADFTVVTNSSLAARVSDTGGRPIVLVDPVPPVPAGTPAYDDTTTVLVVATFAPDEPLDEIIAAAASPECASLKFLVTGRPPPEWSTRELPGNVRMSGFMPEDVYWSQLARAAVVVDVTTMPACIVCGAYEAVAVARPLVLSDDPVNREIFGAAAVYVDPRRESLAMGIAEAYCRRGELVNSIALARATLDDRWRTGAAQLMSALGVGSPNACVSHAIRSSRF